MLGKTQHGVTENTKDAERISNYASTSWPIFLHPFAGFCYSQYLKPTVCTKPQSPSALLSGKGIFMGNDNDNISTRLTYLLIGGGIGAVIALLFAPKSGQELRGDLADATRKGIDKSREAAQQLGERAGEYYESTRERAGELYNQAASRASEVYSQASEKVGEVANTARATAARQTSTVAAAIDAGKKAYQEEKRKTELSGRIEAAPQYTEKSN
jgi:gas vesicle protein